MTREDNIIVPRWFLEVVEDTLRIENNINEPNKKETGESCQDRNIRQSLNGIRKLLKGEELTGMERLEKLQSSLPSNLDEAAEKYAWQKEEPLAEGERLSTCFNPRIEAFKAGAEWTAGQGYSQEDIVEYKSFEIGRGVLTEISPITNLPDSFQPGDKIIIQIRKI